MSWPSLEAPDVPPCLRPVPFHVFDSGIKLGDFCLGGNFFAWQVDGYGSEGFVYFEASSSRRLFERHVLDFSECNIALFEVDFLSFPTSIQPSLSVCA